MNTEPWKIELHGGGSRHKWREVGTSPFPERAHNQAHTLLDRARQGGVRVIDPKGEITFAFWRRHAPGAKPQPINFCIGCGCDDFHACIDPATGGGCSWLIKQLHAGVCNCCSDAMTRWDAGDRKVPA